MISRRQYLHHRVANALILALVLGLVAVASAIVYVMEAGR
jgi:hypothetical protein